MQRSKWMLSRSGFLVLALLTGHCASDKDSPAETGEDTGGAAGRGAGGAAGATGGAGGKAGGGGGKGGAAGSSTSAKGGSGGKAEDGGAAPCDTTLTKYEPDHAKLQYSGRVDFSDAKAPVFSAAGTTVTAKFKGQSFSVLVDDEFRYDNTRGFYDVVVDGEVLDKIQPEKAQSEYCFAASSNGEHVVNLVKRTEPNIGKTTFRGFKFGQILDPPAKPTHRIEVIGDSITCGAGVDAENGSNECNCAVDMAKSGGECPSGQSGWGQPYHDAYKAYGAVVGRTLGVQVHTTCVSGVGLVRNYSSQYDGRPMPEVYDLLHLEDNDASAKWDTSKYVPEAILIGLGTNDFSPGDAPANAPRPIMSVTEFTAKYVEFINTLHSYYPQAHFFLLQSPMLGDAWPDASYTSRTSQWEAINNVVALFAAAGTQDGGTSTDAAGTVPASDAGAAEAGRDARADAIVGADAKEAATSEDAPTTISSVTPAPGVKIDAVKIDQIYPGLGCGTHPSASQQETMATDVVAPFVKSKMGW